MLVEPGADARTAAGSVALSLSSLEFSVVAVNVVGWLAVGIGMVVALPQLVRLARPRKVDGLSLTAWRSVLAMNIAWAAHGVRLEQFALILTNSIGLCSTLPILYLLARQFRRRLLTLILPSLVVAAAMITVDHVLGQLRTASWQSPSPWSPTSVRACSSSVHPMSLVSLPCS